MRLSQLTHLKDKSEYELSVTTENLNNPQEFWGVNSPCESKLSGSNCPRLKDSVHVDARTKGEKKIIRQAL